MKCQQCPKQATLHITEVLGENRFEEVHLCEECAQKYLYETRRRRRSADARDAGRGPGDKQCEPCGIKFVEFRNTGRLGCPHDYEAFKDELLPLLESIHGDTRHAGKTPRGGRPKRVRSQELIAAAEETPAGGDGARRTRRRPGSGTASGSWKRADARRRFRSCDRPGR